MRWKKLPNNPKFEISNVGKIRYTDPLGNLVEITPCIAHEGKGGYIWLDHELYDTCDLVKELFGPDAEAKGRYDR